MKIKTEQMDVTPAMALDWITEHNRRISSGEYRQRNRTEAVIGKYATDMKSGNWILSSDMIVFDVNGNIANGQHRLEAVIKSKCTVPFLVSSGWPPETIDVVDRGKGRTTAQQMALHGWQHASKYSACVQHVCRIITSNHFSISYHATVRILEELDLRSHINRVLLKAQSSRDFAPNVVGPLALYHFTRPNKAEEFAEHLFNFTAAQGSPVQTYLKWMKLGTKLREEHVKGLCACLRAWHNNDQIAAVRLNAEAVKWLADLDSKLSDNIKKIIFFRT